MRNFLLLLVLIAVNRVAVGQRLTPSQLDPKLSDAREKVFTPWCDPEQMA